ncbi:MAG: hypothetical protein HQK79_14780 [Desulfobacterales bacterium]|nr:hypothetical protein [Desulfobacterales bacterium]
MKEIFYSLIIVFFIVCFSSCATFHPRMSSNFKDMSKKINRIAIIQPDIEANFKYYDTDVYFFSEDKSKEISKKLADKLRLILKKKGYDVTILYGKEFEKNSNTYYKHIYATEEIVSKLISLDPAHIEKNLHENFFYDGPNEDLSEYDVVIIVYGFTKGETIRESYKRWIKNFSVNIAMLPISLIKTIIPFAIPFNIDTPTFFAASPDLSWIVLLAFETKNNQIIYINDYFFKSLSLDRGINFRLDGLLKGF